MKRLWTAVFLVGGAALAAQTSSRIIASRISRASFARLESAIDSALSTGEHPCEVLGNTNGVYVDGFGAVFTSIVAASRTKVPTPFQIFTPKDVADVHLQKVGATPLLKAKMREMLFTIAASPACEGVRPEEKIVYGVTLFYFKWEDQTGLPHQIVMRAGKRQLLDLQSGRLPSAEFDQSVITEVL